MPKTKKSTAKTKKVSKKQVEVNEVDAGEDVKPEKTSRQSIPSTW